MWIARINKGNVRNFLTCHHWWAIWFWDFLVFLLVCFSQFYWCSLCLKRYNNLLCQFSCFEDTANQFWRCFFSYWGRKGSSRFFFHCLFSIFRRKGIILSKSIPFPSLPFINDLWCSSSLSKSYWNPLKF